MTTHYGLSYRVSLLAITFVSVAKGSDSPPCLPNMKVIDNSNPRVGFEAENVFSNAPGVEELGTFWIGKLRTTDQYITFDMGCSRSKISQVSIRNSHNRSQRNWGTREFRVEVSKDSPTGPWLPILEKEVADNRLASNPPYVMTYTVDVQYARYVKLTCTKYWDRGCAVQYFAVK